MSASIGFVSHRPYLLAIRQPSLLDHGIYRLLSNKMTNLLLPLLLSDVQLNKLN
ncbi:MAG: hypothetical protein ACTIL9_10445 [Marinomonas sp.]